MTAPCPPLAGRRALVAGLGNIGSALPALLARAGVAALRLVDRDRVEPRNLLAQDYAPDDVGQPKATALARRLRAQFPALAVEAHVADLDDLPRGLAAADVALGALDSRRARQSLVSDLAWPLGVPVIDGGVGDPLLGRVQVFRPGDDSACLECTWGAADYRLAAAEYPCQPGARAHAAPTGAPAHLGAAVAALMAAQAARLLAGPPEKESYEVAFDLAAHHMRRFALRRNPRCRHDHAVVREALRAPRTVGELLDALHARLGDGPVRIEVRPALGRFWAPEGLRPHAAEPLSAHGLVPGDRLRAVARHGVVWIEVTE